MAGPAAAVAAVELAPEEEDALDEDAAWAAAWEEAEREEEAELEAAAGPRFPLLALPDDLLCRVLTFVSHTTLVDHLFRVSARLSHASAAEARTRTRVRLEEALVTGFGAALPEADAPRLKALSKALEGALAGQGAARYLTKCRQLLFNLRDKKNPDLRSRLLSGCRSRARR